MNIETKEVIYLLTVFDDGETFTFKTKSARAAEDVFEVLCRMGIRCILFGKEI